MVAKKEKDEEIYLSVLFVCLFVRSFFLLLLLFVCV